MYLNMEKMMFWRVEKTACLVGVFVCIFLVKVRLLFYFCKCFSCKKTSFTFSFFSLVLFFVLVCFSLSFICLRTVLFLFLYVYHCLTTFVVKSNHEGGQS